MKDRPILFDVDGYPFPTIKGKQKFGASVVIPNEKRREDARKAFEEDLKGLSNWEIVEALTLIHNLHPTKDSPAERIKSLLSGVRNNRSCRCATTIIRDEIRNYKKYKRDGTIKEYRESFNGSKNSMVSIPPSPPETVNNDQFIPVLTYRPLTCVSTPKGVSERISSEELKYWSRVELMKTLIPQRLQPTTPEQWVKLLGDNKNEEELEELMEKFARMTDIGKVSWDPVAEEVIVHV